MISEENAEEKFAGYKKQIANECAILARTSERHMSTDRRGAIEVAEIELQLAGRILLQFAEGHRRAVAAVKGGAGAGWWQAASPDNSLALIDQLIADARVRTWCLG